jgi:hypothetical protein
MRFAPKSVCLCVHSDDIYFDTDADTTWADTAVANRRSCARRSGVMVARLASATIQRRTNSTTARGPGRS